MRLLLFYMLAATAFAQRPDYFPLQVGNQWVYRVAGRGSPSSLVVEVTGQQSMGDHAYFVLRGFPAGELLVRVTDDGKLVFFDSLSHGEATWADFDAAQGASFPSGIDGCSPQATLNDGNAHFESALGVFDHALVFGYSGHCADAGLENEVFVPWIGLVQRTEQTIGGPLTYSLMYVALGGVTFASEPQLSFSLGMTKLTARMTLWNTLPSPATLAFRSSQEFDLVLKDEAGAEVYRWSAGKAFAQLVHELRISGEKNWVVPIPATIPNGRYTAEAVLTTTPPGQYAASVAFQIAND